MAQIWLTYEELGEFCGCSFAHARMNAIQQQWPRRRSSDGQSRVKLPNAMMLEFVVRMAAQLQGVRTAADVEMHRARSLAAPLAPAIARQTPGMPDVVDRDAIVNAASDYLRPFLPERAGEALPPAQRIA